MIISKVNSLELILSTSFESGSVSAQNICLYKLISTLIVRDAIMLTFLNVSGTKNLKNEKLVKQIDK